jgi:hypothetical protein
MVPSPNQDHCPRSVPVRGGVAYVLLGTSGTVDVDAGATYAIDHTLR